MNNNLEFDFNERNKDRSTYAYRSHIALNKRLRNRAIEFKIALAKLQNCSENNSDQQSLDISGDN